MLYLVSGKEEFLREEFVGQLKTLMRNLPLGEHNIEEIGPASSVDAVRAACDCVPFLCEKRMVIVRGLIGQLDRGNRASGRAGRPRASSPPASREALAGLVSYVQRLPGTTHLVLVEEETAALGAFAAAVPDAVRRDFHAPRGEALPAWVVERARKRGARISQHAARELASLVGPNLRALDAEVGKLATYVDAGQTIEMEHVGQVASGGSPDVFALQDAVAEQRPGAALSALRGLVAKGSDPLELFGQIAGLVRRLLIVKELVSLHLPLQREAPAYGLSASQYALDKLRAQAQRWTAAELEQAHALLRDTDLAIKTGRAEPELAVELVATKITTMSLGPSAVQTTKGRLRRLPFAEFPIGERQEATG